MFLVYYRALVNFTDSVTYSPELEDIFSLEFKEISEAVMDTVCLTSLLDSSLLLQDCCYLLRFSYAIYVLSDLCV